MNDLPTNDSQTQPPPQEDGMTLMTVEEVCKLLNFTERYVRKLIKIGKLEPVRINLGTGRDPIRLRRRDVLALIGPRRTGPAPGS